jgi:DNA invertase Pin-like site-specific DNA recombinase
VTNRKPLAAAYARYSTDKQSDTSIEDQVRVCRAQATRMQLEIGEVFSDSAVSGGVRVSDRDGGKALLAGRFEVLFVESLSRLSRDGVDGEMVIRRLEHRGVRIIGCADGYDSNAGGSRKLLRMVHGAMNEKYRDDMAHLTHRGLDGQVARGYHAGGLSFGYRSAVVGYDHRGEPIGHALEVVPEQAAIVREVFARYGAGESCQAIAHDLNARRVAGPRGRTWSVSALYGSPAKGSGILNNELYVGRYVWNRSHWVKDPDTGQRQRFERPREDWRIVDRPTLRILENSAWQAVRARMASPRRLGGTKGRGNAPSSLLGGILRCGLCGGAMIAVNTTMYGCAARKDRGAAVCPGVYVRRDAMERTLLGHLESVLLAPATLATIERRAVEMAAAIAKEQARGVATEVGVRELEAEVARLTDAIAAVGISPALAERLRASESALGQARRARKASGGVTVHHAVIKARARELAADLAAALRQDSVARARDSLRAALGEVRVAREDGAMFAEFEDSSERMLLAVGGESLGMVAGTRNLTRLLVA